MSDNFRIVECMHCPSQVFTIYDYTKIAYLAGSYICLRQIMNKDIKPVFIRIENRFKVIHALTAFPNCLVILDQNFTRDLFLHFYGQELIHLKISSEIVKKSEADNEFTIQTHITQKNIFIFVTRDVDNEVIVINFEQKKVVAKGFFSGEMIDLSLKINQNIEGFTTMFKDGRITYYELVSNRVDINYKILQKKTYELALTKDSRHCWIKDELIISTKDDIKVLVGEKQIEKITDFKNIKLIKSIVSGFIVCNESHIRIYKKSSSFFELKTEYYASEIKGGLGIQLSPQEDIFSFYDKESNRIAYALEFDVDEERSNKKLKQLELCTIGHHSEQNVSIFPSNQSIFINTIGSQINVYSPSTFQCYISIKAFLRQMTASKKKILRASTLISEKSVNFEERLLTQEIKDEKIDVLTVHPSQNVIAVAFKNFIRVYQILYNEFKVLKEIQITNCKELLFNNSGSLLGAKVSGKQGSKISLFKTLQNYELLDVLAVNKKIEVLRWSKHDSQVYGFHQKGYCSWGLNSLFKDRVESEIVFDFSLTGAGIDHKNHLVVWGEHDILKILNDEILEHIKLPQKEVSNILFQNQHYILLTGEGEIYKSKDLTQNIFANYNAFKISDDEKPHRLNICTIQNNVLICLTEEKNIFCFQWGNQEKQKEQLVQIQRKKIIKYQNQYKKYQENIAEIQDQLLHSLEVLKQEFLLKEKQQRQSFLAELKDREERYHIIKNQRNKIETTMEENIAAHEQDTLMQIKELQRIYERKIAITTNKLLTSEEINYRNRLLAESNLKMLEERHGDNIVSIREEYAKSITQNLCDKDFFKHELYQIKTQYQTRISQLEQQNDTLLKHFQQSTQKNIVNLKKNVVNLELKYTDAVSQKFNLEKQFDEKKMEIQKYRAQNQYVVQKLREEERRCEFLGKDMTKVSNLLIDKDKMVEYLHKKISDLQKSNEIFKYRIVEMKAQNDPKQEEVIKLKDNMTELEEQYDKIANKAHQHEQQLALHKKEASKFKELLEIATQKEKKLQKNYANMIDQVRDATKSPIQEIRKILLKLLEKFDVEGQSGKIKFEHLRAASPLGQLNRVREHLEVCLIEAVDSSKKNEEMKDYQINKKNRQNSELLTEINDLRRKIKNLEKEMKQRDLQIQRLIKGQPAASDLQVHPRQEREKEKRSTTNFESASKELTKNKTRESFFEKSLFKNNWREKRLKTEQGSRKKKTSYSIARNQTHHLLIENRNEDIEEFKRIIEQKETIIKQLINKIHRLS